MDMSGVSCNASVPVPHLDAALMNSKCLQATALRFQAILGSSRHCFSNCLTKPASVPLIRACSELSKEEILNAALGCKLVPSPLARFYAALLDLEKRSGAARFAYER